MLVIVLLVLLPNHSFCLQLTSLLAHRATSRGLLGGRRAYDKLSPIQWSFRCVSPAKTLIEACPPECVESRVFLLRLDPSVQVLAINASHFPAFQSSQGATRVLTSHLTTRLPPRFPYPDRSKKAATSSTKLTCIQAFSLSFLPLHRPSIDAPTKLRILVCDKLSLCSRPQPDIPNTSVTSRLRSLIPLPTPRRRSLQFRNSTHLPQRPGLDPSRMVWIFCATLVISIHHQYPYILDAPLASIFDNALARLQLGAGG
jgi:hypothetical protein